MDPSIYENETHGDCVANEGEAFTTEELARIADDLFQSLDAEESATEDK